MKVRAAVAHEAGKPLAIETVDLDGPRGGEVMVEIRATGVCHTDEFTRSGADPEGLFPGARSARSSSTPELARPRPTSYIRRHGRRGRLAGSWLSESCPECWQLLLFLPHLVPCPLSNST